MEVKHTSSKEWFYCIGSDALGPCSWIDIKSKLKATLINLDTLIWCKGQPDWSPLSKHTDLLSQIVNHSPVDSNNHLPLFSKHFTNLPNISPSFSSSVLSTNSQVCILPYEQSNQVSIFSRSHSGLTLPLQPQSSFIWQDKQSIDQVVAHDSNGLVLLSSGLSLTGFRYNQTAAISQGDHLNNADETSPSNDNSTISSSSSSLLSAIPSVCPASLDNPKDLGVLNQPLFEFNINPVEEERDTASRVHKIGFNPSVADIVFTTAGSVVQLWDINTYSNPVSYQLNSAVNDMVYMYMYIY